MVAPKKNRLLAVFVHTLLLLSSTVVIHKQLFLYIAGTVFFHKFLNRYLQRLRYQPQIAQAVPVAVFDLAYLRLAETYHCSELFLTPTAFSSQLPYSGSNHFSHHLQVNSTAELTRKSIPYLE